jgi:hypothetical protein
MLRPIFLFFVLLALICVVKEKDEDIRRETKTLHRLDVLKTEVVDTSFTLFIPVSIKFGQKLVNTKRQGVVKFYINNRLWCYVRPNDVQRNEYYLDSSCSDKTREVDVYRGDDLEFDFSESNMLRPGKVALYGEKDV